MAVFPNVLLESKFEMYEQAVKDFAAITCCLWYHTVFFLRQAQRVFIDHHGAHGARGF